MKRFVLLAFTALALLGSAPAAYAEKFDLVCQGLTMTHASSDVLRAAFDEIRRESGGELNISFVQTGAIVKMEGAYTALRDGMMDLGYYNTMNVASIMPYSQALALPWMADDAVHAQRIAERLFVEIPEIKKELTKDVVHLAMFSSDRNAFLGSTPIHSPADLKGKRVMTWLPDLLDEIKGYGATPVPVAVTDVYVGLQRGLGDVVYGSLPMFRTLKLTEVAKQFTVMPGTSCTLQIVAANVDSFEGLPEKYRALVQNRFANLGMVLSQTIYDYGVRDIEYFEKEEGVSVYYPTEEELKQFREASMPAMRQAALQKLGNYGIKDPEAYMERIYAIAADITPR